MRSLALALIGLLLSAPLQGGWHLVPPRNARKTGTLPLSMLEASGAAVSRSNREVIWTINDSGNPPELLATDTLGRHRATITLDGATNHDWEEVALGPCRTATCVYIADTGDNGESRTEVQLYRLVEPTLPAGATGVTRQSTRNFEVLHLRYPDGPHDVEAMTVTPAGELLVVTKGRSHGVIEFRLPATAWDTPGLHTAERVDSLPIAPSGGSGQLITGMALSPDGHRVVIRSYRELFLFTLGPNGALRPDGPTSCDVLGLEPQGEGIAFLDEKQLVLTSERGLFKAGTVYVMECGPIADGRE